MSQEFQRRAPLKFQAEIHHCLVFNSAPLISWAQLGPAGHSAPHVLVNWQEFVSILRRYDRRKGQVDGKVPGGDLADACKVPICVGLLMNLGEFPKHNYADASCHVQITFI